MTKQAFLTELTQKLAILSEPLRNEIVGDFAEHFSEGAAQGFSEEDICRNLGQPSVIAEQFLEEYAAQTKSSQPLDAEPQNINQRNINQQNNDQQRGEFIPPIPPILAIPPISQITDAIQDAVKGFVSPDQYYEINIHKSFTGIRDIAIDLQNSNLYIKPDPQTDQVTVRIKGRARHDRFVVEDHNGALVVTENGVKYPFGFFLPRRVLLDTTIMVPMHFMGGITAQVANGEAEVSHVNGRELRLKSSLRKTFVSGCRFNSFVIHTSAGNLEFSDCAGEIMNLRASAGSMRIDNTSGILEADCSAGRLTVNRHTGERLKVKSSAGDVIITDCAAEIDANSSAGAVRIQCEGKILQRVKAHSSAGEIMLEADETKDIDLSSSAGNAIIRVRTIRGDIRLHSSAGNMLLEARGVNGNIDAKASAGNITIRLPENIDCRIEASSRMGSVKRGITGNDQSSYVLKASASMGTILLEPIN